MAIDHIPDVPERGEEALDALFTQYRAACPDPEPSPDFSPRLWQKIEARQNWRVSLKRLSQALVTAAAALCLLMALFLYIPRHRTSAYYNATYLDVLASNDQKTEAEAYFEQVHAEPDMDVTVQ
jgi:hypothetical protein